MSTVIKEIPVGAIDGINTVFTLANEIDYIDDVFFDGAVYTCFVIDGNKITFEHAPKYSLEIDYVPKEEKDNCTTGEIISEVYNLTGQNANNQNYNRDRVLKKINSICSRILKGRVTSILDNSRTFRAGNLGFNDSYTNIRYKVSSCLQKEISLGDRELCLDASSLLPQGYVQIGCDIVKYLSKTDDGIQGVSGITIDHDIGDRVEQLYEMPSDFFKTNEVHMLDQSSSSIRTRKKLIPFDSTQSYLYYYDIIRIDCGVLMKIHGLCEDDLVCIDYSKKFNKLEQDTDECPFPDCYGIDVVANMVAGELLYQRGVPNGELLLNDGYTYLQNMYQEYTNEINIIKHSIKPQNYNFHSVRGRVNGAYRNNFYR